MDAIFEKKQTWMTAHLRLHLQRALKAPLPGPTAIAAVADYLDALLGSTLLSAAGFDPPPGSVDGWGCGGDVPKMCELWMDEICSAK